MSQIAINGKILEITQDQLNDILLIIDRNNNTTRNQEINISNLLDVVVPTSNNTEQPSSESNDVRLEVSNAVSNNIEQPSSESNDVTIEVSKLDIAKKKYNPSPAEKRFTRTVAETLKCVEPYSICMAVVVLIIAFSFLIYQLHK